MSISIPGSSSTPSLTMAKNPERTRPAASISSSEDPVARTTPVTLSGKALLMSRLFAGHAQEPAVTHPSKWLEAVDPIPFLTINDRKLLADVYQFANDEGADLAYVDNLACGLAYYRVDDNGRRILPQTPGTSFDREGHEVTYLFTEKNATTAARILQSDGFKSTQLDTGFLRHALDARYSALTYLNFEFVEQVVNKFSSVGATLDDFGGCFSHFQPNQKNWIKHLSTEVYDVKTRLPLSKTSVSENPAGADESMSAATTGSSESVSMTLREAIKKYLEENALPALFETLMRFRR
ncbi:hypothetical protein [Pseudomonas abietaniphila]